MDSMVLTRVNFVSPIRYRQLERSADGSICSTSGMKLSSYTSERDVVGLPKPCSRDVSKLKTTQRLPSRLILSAMTGVTYQYQHSQVFH